MSELAEVAAVFGKIGLNYTCEPMSEFDIGWYDLPVEWQGHDTIRAAGALFVFDEDGNFVGVGIGDEQSSYEERIPGG